MVVKGTDCKSRILTLLAAAVYHFYLQLSYLQTPQTKDRILCFGPVVPLAVFLTGSDRIPIHGMESLRIIIQSTTAEEHYLPVAHTCYNLLDMPRYQTKEILRCRLTQAVEQYEGFSLV